MIHTAEKSLAEYGSKVAQSDKSAVESAVAGLKTALEGDDLTSIKARTEDLVQASMKLGEAMYKSQGEPGAAPDAAAPEGAKDDVIDADFKEVGDDDKKKSA
jgi:molecular chaperone DnaK